MYRPEQHRYVALLRGVNVGGQRRIPMADLRAALSSSGLGGVRTYLQSGNVIFDARTGDTHAHQETIARILRDDLGQDVDVLVLSCSELQRIVADNPFSSQAAADDRSVHALLLFTPVSVASFAALEPPADEGELAVLGEGVIYLHLPHGYGRSKLTGEYFERKFGAPTTARNWRTVLALQEMCPPV
jgi:uncharacterized protein (DUF1697 family)